VTGDLGNGKSTGDDTAAVAATAAALDATGKSDHPKKMTMSGLLELVKPKFTAEDCLPSAALAEFQTKALALKDPSNDVAEEFAASLRLANKIRSRLIEIPGAGQRLNFIFNCLTKSPPLLVLARDARLQLQIEVYRKSGLSRILANISDGSPAGLVLTALVTSLFIWTSVAFLIYAMVHKFDIGLASDIFFMNGPALAVISSAAFIGGVISIATRLQEFSRVRDLDPFAMFWTALLKPLIGVVLSFFILATLSGGVISFSFLSTEAIGDFTKPMPPDTLKAMYVLWMFGFLAGFSERFAWDFVNRAEGTVSGSKNQNGAQNGAVDPNKPRPA
jgi:hypothetical protein